jgi:hypothetical protein
VTLLSKIAISKTQIMEKQKNLLNSVNFDSGFHFFIELGRYTGVTANGTIEFAEKIQIIPIQSVTFHFCRQDFQKWFKNTIGDEELAKRIDMIGSELQDEDLRKELTRTVQKRIAELTKASQQISH